MFQIQRTVGPLRRFFCAGPSVPLRMPQLDPQQTTWWIPVKDEFRYFGHLDTTTPAFRQLYKIYIHVNYGKTLRLQL